MQEKLMIGYKNELSKYNKELEDKEELTVDIYDKYEEDNDHYDITPCKSPRLVPPTSSHGNASFIWFLKKLDTLTPFRTLKPNSLARLYAKSQLCRRCQFLRMF